MSILTCAAYFHNQLPRLEKQPGDAPPVPFSFLTSAIETPQVVCHITHTGPETHAVIAANLDRAPIYSGQIESTGPRYCPSIEDKIVRFRQRQSPHLLYSWQSRLPQGTNSGLER